MNKLPLAIIIINEKHVLRPQQKEMIDEVFAYTQIYHSPADGWTQRECLEVAKDLIHQPDYAHFVFISPIPYLVGIMGTIVPERTWIFHNNVRNKIKVGTKEVSKPDPNGWEMINFADAITELIKITTQPKVRHNA